MTRPTVFKGDETWPTVPWGEVSGLYAEGVQGQGFFEKPMSESQNHVEKIFWPAHVPPTSRKPDCCSYELRITLQWTSARLSNVWLESGGKTLEQSSTPVKAMHYCDLYSSVIKYTHTKKSVCIWAHPVRLLWWIGWFFFFYEREYISGKESKNRQVNCWKEKCMEGQDVRN